MTSTIIQIQGVIQGIYHRSLGLKLGKQIELIEKVNKKVNYSLTLFPYTPQKGNVALANNDSLVAWVQYLLVNWNQWRLPHWVKVLLTIFP